MRYRTQQNIDSDCGGVPINLCGKARAMVMDMQFQLMVKHKGKVECAKYNRIIENILQEKAEEYFKNKK